MKDRIFINIDDFGFVYDGVVEGGFAFIATNLRMVKALYEYLNERQITTMHIYGEGREFVGDDNTIFTMFPVNYDVDTVSEALSLMDAGTYTIPFREKTFVQNETESFGTASIVFTDATTCMLIVSTPV